MIPRTKSSIEVASNDDDPDRCRSRVVAGAGGVREDVRGNRAQRCPRLTSTRSVENPATPFDFGGRALTTTFLDRRPLRDRRALALPLMPVAWRLVDTPEEPYDLVVTSSHAFANLARPTKDAGAVLCYCHTPAAVPLGARTRPGPQLGSSRSSLRRGPCCRRIDLRGASRVTEFAANSSEVADRIRRFYDRDAIVIPPPVDTEFFASDDPVRPRCRPKPPRLPDERIRHGDVSIHSVQADRLGDRDRRRHRGADRRRWFWRRRSPPPGHRRSDRP